MYQCDRRMAVAYGNKRLQTVMLSNCFVSGMAIVLCVALTVRKMNEDSGCHLT